MKPIVYLTKKIPKDVEDYIAEYCEVRKWEGTPPIPRQELLMQLQDVDGLLTTGGSIDDELLEHAPNLKVVSNVSVGYNNFDIEAMKKRNVVGTHTPYVLDDTVADLVLALMLASARRIPELDRYVKEGKWAKDNDRSLFGVDVHHATVGIIGMGRIGEAIAKRAIYGFDMNVLYYNRSRKREVEEYLGVKYAELELLLQQSDFVVLMTPLTDETKHFMSHDQFDLMKESAFFINASRGETVDEEALIKALQNGEIKGAGLDVFSKEPVDSDNPLLQLDNVVTVPHIGSATTKTRDDMAFVAAKNLVSALKGEEPEHLVKEFKLGK
ncbi:2-hydroxyacid dehydrogenase [Halalkalibacter nanhaiisediminis]|uniref:Gluconate 2-dehydrogenase n=1 Tax=Halalkalibacter nanhaiisediminis TaxID=688079 RepID=A0A562QMN7_9BACI|nr:D-glycerate dehydrogenase [Halalkalibacter nanhaiisediminis]TWI58004.1 gluconate 2-dehydrogenase [Halalkalibacter nanhaiisediminis]